MMSAAALARRIRQRLYRDCSLSERCWLWKKSLPLWASIITPYCLMLIPLSLLAGRLLMVEDGNPFALLCGALFAVTCTITLGENMPSGTSSALHLSYLAYAPISDREFFWRTFRHWLFNSIFVLACLIVLFFAFLKSASWVVLAAAVSQWLLVLFAAAGLAIYVRIEFDWKFMLGLWGLLLTGLVFTSQLALYADSIAKYVLPFLPLTWPCYAVQQYSKGEFTSCWFYLGSCAAFGAGGLVLLARKAAADFNIHEFGFFEGQPSWIETHEDSVEERALWQQMQDISSDELDQVTDSDEEESDWDPTVPPYLSANFNFWKYHGFVGKAVKKFLSTKEQTIVEMLYSGPFMGDWSQRWWKAARWLACALAVVLLLPVSAEYYAIPACLLLIFSVGGAPIFGGPWASSDVLHQLGFSRYFHLPLSFNDLGLAIVKANAVRTLLWLPVALVAGLAFSLKIEYPLGSALVVAAKTSLVILVVQVSLIPFHTTNDGTSHTWSHIATWAVLIGEIILISASGISVVALYRGEMVVALIGACALTILAWINWQLLRLWNTHGPLDLAVKRRP